MLYLTFSSNDDLHSVYYKVKSLLKSNGFYLNNKKTHFVNANHRQSVTGIVVNEFPQVSKEYRKKLRQEIYYCQKYNVSHTNYKDFSFNNRKRINEYTQNQIK